MTDAREPLVVQAKRQLDALTADHLATLLPLLYLSQHDLQELARVAAALGRVRDRGYGHVRAVIHGGRLTLMEELLQEKVMA